MEDLISLIEVLGSVCLAANVVTANTNSTSENKYINILKIILNFLSGNFGKNKNADDK